MEELGPSPGSPQEENAARADAPGRRGRRKHLCVSHRAGKEDSGRAARVAGLGRNARNAGAFSPACPT